MTHKIELLTPVGRLVQGSLYVGRTTDAEGRPLITKSGQNAGKPAVNYFFAIAIEKRGETHWNQTEWGAKIWKIGQAGFPNGQYMSPAFAWKIKDGDSAIPNTKGIAPCQMEGFPGHWILNFSKNNIPPMIYTDNGDRQLLEPEAVKLGDYIQCYGDVADNEAVQQPGVYLNFKYVCLIREGRRIVVGLAAKDVGFGGEMPQNILLPDPMKTGFNPAAVPVSPVHANTAYTNPPAHQPSPVTPHYGILAGSSTHVPVAPTPMRIQILPSANGVTYEQFRMLGMTDDQLISKGLAHYV